MDQGGPLFRRYLALARALRKVGNLNLLLIREEGSPTWHLLRAGCSCPWCLDLVHGLGAYERASMVLDAAQSVKSNAPVYRLADGSQAMLRGTCEICAGLLIAALRERAEA